jgi:predicted acyl esterase
LAARLFVSTTARDAHVVLRVEDVAPTGEVVELTAGWDTLSFRALDRNLSDIEGDLVVRPHHPYTRESVLPVEPGEIYEWWVEIRPTSVHLPAGHTLRLAVQTSDAARFLPTVPALPNMAGGVLSIHHDRGHPSALVLPVERR